MPYLALLYFVFAAVVRTVFRVLYGTRKHRKYVFERFRQMLYDFESRNGGSIREWTSWIEYKFQDDLRIRATFRGRPALKIFLPQGFLKSIYLYRIPTYLYSFIKPLITRPGNLQDLPFISSGEDVDELNQNVMYRNVLDRLSESGYSIRINKRGMTLTKTLTQEDGIEAFFMEKIKIIREFARLLQGHVIEIPINPITTESRCAYCKEEILAQLDITNCLQCWTPHHRECFDLNSGCSVFGCNSKQQTQATRQREPVLHQ